MLGKKTRWLVSVVEVGPMNPQSQSCRVLPSDVQEHWLLLYLKAVRVSLPDNRLSRCLLSSHKRPGSFRSTSIYRLSQVVLGRGTHVVHPSQLITGTKILCTADPSNGTTSFSNFGSLELCIHKQSFAEGKTKQAFHVSRILSKATLVLC
jgi:hypothetical protein